MRWLLSRVPPIQEGCSRAGRPGKVVPRLRRRAACTRDRTRPPAPQPVVAAVGVASLGRLAGAKDPSP